MKLFIEQVESSDATVIAVVRLARQCNEAELADEQT